MLPFNAEANLLVGDRGWKVRVVTRGCSCLTYLRLTRVSFTQWGLFLQLLMVCFCDLRLYNLHRITNSLVFRWESYVS